MNDFDDNCAYYLNSASPGFLSVPTTGLVYFIILSQGALIYCRDKVDKEIEEEKYTKNICIHCVKLDTWTRHFGVSSMLLHLRIMIYVEKDTKI